jgi:hypothetical protein
VFFLWSSSSLLLSDTAEGKCTKYKLQSHIKSDEHSHLRWCEQLIKHKFPQYAPANLETSCLFEIDDVSRKLRLRCSWQFLWCALSLTHQLLWPRNVEDGRGLPAKASLRCLVFSNESQEHDRRGNLLRLNQQVLNTFYMSSWTVEGALGLIDQPGCLLRLSY